MTPEQYEYQYFHVDKRDHVRELNRLGAQGWQIVSITAEVTRLLVLCMRRR